MMKKKRVDLNDLNNPPDNQTRVNYREQNPQSFNNPSPAPQVNPYPNNNYQNLNSRPVSPNSNYDARHVAENQAELRKKDKKVKIRNPEAVKKKRIKAIKLTYRIVLILGICFLAAYFIYAIFMII